VAGSHFVGNRESRRVIGSPGVGLWFSATRCLQERGSEKQRAKGVDQNSVPGKQKATQIVQTAKSMDEWDERDAWGKVHKATIQSATFVSSFVSSHLSM